MGAVSAYLASVPNPQWAARITFVLVLVGIGLLAAVLGWVAFDPPAAEPRLFAPFRWSPSSGAA